MMPRIEVCVHCSHKIEEKEKSVDLPAGVAHLACAQKTTTRTRASYLSPGSRFPPEFSAQQTMHSRGHIHA
jgi:hypothetical protein